MGERLPKDKMPLEIPRGIEVYKSINGPIYTVWALAYAAALIYFLFSVAFTSRIDVGPLVLGGSILYCLYGLHLLRDGLSQVAITVDATTVYVEQRSLFSVTSDRFETGDYEDMYMSVGFGGSYIKLKSGRYVYMGVSASKAVKAAKFIEQRIAAMRNSSRPLTQPE